MVSRTGPQGDGTRHGRLRRRRRGVAGAAMGLAMAVALGACGPSPANVGHGPLGIQPDIRPAAVTITIDNYAYHPAMVTVAAGQRVAVINYDGVSHTITAYDGAFATGPISPGGAASAFVIDKVGTYRYQDTLHPYMHGEIVVTR